MNKAKLNGVMGIKYRNVNPGLTTTMNIDRKAKIKNVLRLSLFDEERISSPDSDEFSESL
jgi:hypothetical protein